MSEQTELGASPYSARPAGLADRRAVAAIWAASQAADGPVFRPRRGWSLLQWATTIILLQQRGRSIGLAGLSSRASPAIAEGRLALQPDQRTAEAAHRLIELAAEHARDTAAERLRLSISASAGWARAAAQDQGFRLIRTIYRMLRPADAPLLPVQPPEGVRIRPLQPREDEAALAALNRAWADTWNFRPIPMAALAADLDGQREGFLLALEKPQERVIAGTVHAIFDRTAKNPDDGPHAWISNLTVIPTWRGRGLGRALLAAGLHHLAGRGARSAGLGVDGGNPVPVSLYRSVGFEVIDTMELWERPISAPSAGGLA